ncbi:MAG: amidophosphoribosyltransferase, partial [Bacteroidota bacterium]
QLQKLYDRYTDEEISSKIAGLLTPPDIEPEVDVIYQTVEDLRASCPRNNGDWYFSGNYPTPGGNRVVNQAFVYYMEGIDLRAY